MERGFLLAGGKRSSHRYPSLDSGHIAVLNRGEVEKSDFWKGLVPIAMETGERRRWAARALSLGFGKEKKAGTKFYRYQGPIKKKQTL